MAPDSLSIELATRLAALEDQSQRRHLRPLKSPESEINGAQGEINFSSNDYLGLAREPFLAEAASRALEKYGTGAGASRLICGNHAPHVWLEEALAKWKGTEAAITFSSGYATALGTIQALVGSDDVIVMDKLCHASIIDGARLSGARIRVYPHNHLGRLEHLLKRSREGGPSKRILLVTESVFSMDGDLASLAEIIALKERYGAWLMVDEAHGVGVFGETGGGLGQATGLARHIDVQMGTLSKALGCSGGYVCGSKLLVDWLINKARSLIYSTAPAPAIASAALAAVSWMPSHEANQRRRSLWARIANLQEALPHLPRPQSAIIPVFAGSNEAAVAWSHALAEKGFGVPAIRYPTVPRGQSRLRISLSALHSPVQITALADALSGIERLEGCKLTL